jgi:hypothetical protein
VTHAAGRERRARRQVERLHRGQARHRPQLREIGGDENTMNSGERLGLRNVDPPDGRVRVRRAQDMAPQAVRACDIVDVTALAGEETQILNAAN